MERLSLIFVLLLLSVLASPATAQDWTAQISDDRVFDGGWATAPGRSVGMHCAARKPGQGPAMDSQWVETTIPDPWRFVLSFSDQLFPGPAYQRDDVILFIDQTGYRLPTVYQNELAGGWEVTLSLTDPLYRAMTTGQRMVMQVGPDAAWEIPMQGAGRAIEQVVAVCAATWQRTGNRPPNALTAPGEPGARQDVGLRHWAEQSASTACSDFFTAGPNGFLTANIDGDGIPDVIVNYNDITCDNDGRRPGVCGASLCSVDVFLSRTFARTNRPEQLLGMSAAFVDLSNGNQALSITGNLSMCQDRPDCTFLWYWDGGQFTELPR